jgi:APA family basic amino acid/polyamine antiporter
LPRRWAKVHAKTGTPVLMTILTGIVAAAIAGFFPLKEIAELANAGTLCAFVAVSLSMMILRMREPNLKRRFKTPVWWLVGPLAITGCAYLFWNLPAYTQIRFFIWNGIGLVIYFLFARTSSNLAKGQS